MRNFDEEAKSNSRLYNYKSDLIFRGLMLKDFVPYINSSVNSSSLEIGSSDGSMTAQILEHVPFLHIVEPSKDMIEIVNHKFTGRVETHFGTIEEINLDMRFDNIFLIHTLEHLDDPGVVLEKIGELLSPQGKLFLAVPNGNALSRQIAVHMGLIPFNTFVLPNESLQGHLRTYTIDTFRNEILSSGYKVELLTGVFLKALANFQLDRALELEIIDKNYIEAANSLAKLFPDFSASIIAVCSK